LQDLCSLPTQIALECTNSSGNLSHIETADPNEKYGLRT
jgi:hypothetical protein